MNKLGNFLNRHGYTILQIVGLVILTAFVVVGFLYLLEGLATSFAGILAPLMQEVSLENECAAMGYPESLMTLDNVTNTWSYYCIKLVEGTNVVENLFDLREAVQQ